MKQSSEPGAALTAFLWVVAIGAALVGAGCGGGGGGKDAGGGTGGTTPGAPIVISTTTRTARTTTLSVNYWQWAPTYGDYTTGTETLVAALHPATMRVGGYNNDANKPDPFDGAELDRAVAYARAIGAEPIIQVPRLGDVDGTPPTADDAAAIVRYANVSKGYALKYFAVGNEPDLYDTMGLAADPTMPAIPGYRPADFCTATRAYVGAMKAVDPTIQIVGPDLAYKYQIGNGDYDWLSPILAGCGELFDVVAIHRYPFAADQALLPSAAADAAAFRAVITSVRGAMQAVGQGGKPLAITEMNVAYNATTCVHDASPGTVGSALWLADMVGTSIGLDLWTSAIWNVSDTQDWSLGLIGGPPAHQPRPEYWAYALYADHFGPTLLAAPPSLPSGVRAYASRNAADDATEVIVVNWGAADAALAFSVTGLASAPAVRTFVLPGTSLAAVEIADSGAATALTYGEAQRQRGVGPEPLAPAGTPAGSDAGAGAGGAGGAAGKMPGSGCATDGGLVCPQVAATSAAITTMGTQSGTGVSFGPASQRWGSYSYAAPGQVAPTGAVTSDGNGLQIAGGFDAAVTAASNYSGFGLYFASSSCLDGSAYQGVKFDISGDLGSCRLALGATFSGDLSHVDDPGRGACSGTSANCYGPSADVTAAAGAATAASPTIQVPFSSLAGGMPITTFDRANIVGVQWQLSATLGGGADGGNACAAAFTVAGVSFY